MTKRKTKGALISSHRNEYLGFREWTNNLQIRQKTRFINSRELSQTVNKLRTTWHRIPVLVFIVWAVQTIGICFTQIWERIGPKIWDPRVQKLHFDFPGWIGSNLLRMPYDAMGCRIERSIHPALLVWKNKIERTSWFRYNTRILIQDDVSVRKRNEKERSAIDGKKSA
jgi:hypothetical protein